MEFCTFLQFFFLLLLKQSISQFLNVHLTFFYFPPSFSVAFLKSFELVFFFLFNVLSNFPYLIMTSPNLKKASYDLLQTSQGIDVLVVNCIDYI